MPHLGYQQLDARGCGLCDSVGWRRPDRGSMGMVARLNARQTVKRSLVVILFGKSLD